MIFDSKLSCFRAIFIGIYDSWYKVVEFSEVEDDFEVIIKWLLVII